MSAADRLRARAEALGVWADTAPMSARWTIRARREVGYVIDRWQGGGPGVHLVGQWFVDEATAEVWLLALASGATVTRTCPVCDGERVEQKKVHVETMWNVRLEWAAKGTADVNGMQLIERPCPACSATGAVRVEAARVVCEAAPRTATREFGSDTVWSTGSRYLDGHDPLPGIVPELQGGWSAEWELNNQGGKERCHATHPGRPIARTELLAVAYGLDPGASDEQRARPPEYRETRSTPSSRFTSEEQRMLDNGWVHTGGTFVDGEHRCTWARWLGREPDEALVLRDYLETVGVEPHELTIDVLADFRRPPDTDFGRVLVAWLGGEACTLCSGQGSPAYQWFKCECSRCEATGLEVSALLAQVAS